MIVEWVQTSRVGPVVRAAHSRLSGLSWWLKGRPDPMPPHRKRRAVCAAIREVGAICFVETGTYRGDTLASVRKLVRHAWTVELDPRLARFARRRFRDARNVTVVEGDSAAVLPRLVPSLDGTTVFWLDGHFSGGVTGLGSTETPLLAELDVVLGPDAPQGIVLIDDARLLTGDDGYPTLREVEERVHRRAPQAAVDVVGDAVWIRRGSGVAPADEH